MTNVPAVAMADVERIFRHEYGRAVSVLARLCADIDDAEEAVQDAFYDGRGAMATQRRPAESVRLDHRHRAQSRH